MNVAKFILPAILIVCASLLIVECTINTRKRKDPVFDTDTKSLSSDITGAVPTREINIVGFEINTNGTITSELEISLINPKYLPTDTTDLNQVAQKIAVIVNRALKVSESFTYCKVLFINRKTDGALTKTSSVTRSYKFDDLKNYAYVLTLGERFDSLPTRAAGKSVFSESDSEIVSVLSYFDLNSNLSGHVELLKETDTAVLRLTTRDLGKLDTGHNYLVHRWKIADFYSLEGMKSGSYRFEYFIRDTLVGSKSFTLLD